MDSWIHESGVVEKGKMDADQQVIAQQSSESLQEAELPQGPGKEASPRPASGRILARMLRNRGAVVAALLLALLALGAVLAPFLRTDPTAMNLGATSQAPSLHHLFGTDQFGRDIFIRVLYGGRTTLPMGVVAVALASIVGIPLGLVVGYFEGWLDAVIMRVMDMMLAFPGLLLAMAVVAALGQGVTNVMIAVGISLIPSYVRLTRGTVLSAKQNDYVEAARALGAPTWKILAFHILPNMVAPLLVLVTVSAGWAIVIGATLNFLGLGVQYPTPEWGSDLNSGRDYFREEWWLSTFPGIALMATVLSINRVGDGLREVLDPGLRLER